MQALFFPKRYMTSLKKNWLIQILLLTDSSSRETCERQYMSCRYGLFYPLINYIHIINRFCYLSLEWDEIINKANNMTSQQVSYAQLPVSYDSCHFSPCEEDNLTI